jgi:prolyl-tRNA synthetase
LGQNFAKSSGIRFQGRNGEFEYAWTTSWGVSTRLIGALIMAHSDDNGLVLPPKIAPSHAVLIPIYRNEEEHVQVMDFAKKLELSLKNLSFEGIKIYTELDDRDLTSSERNWYWIKKGIPLRIEIGPRDIAQNTVMVARRDMEPRDKQSIAVPDLTDYITATLSAMQITCYERALAFRDANIVQIDDKDEFYKFFTPKNANQPEIHGGFANSHWCGSADCEEKIKTDLKVSIRVIPFDAVIEDGQCISCGNKSHKRVIFAKAY